MIEAARASRLLAATESVTEPSMSSIKGGRFLQIDSAAAIEEDPSIELVTLDDTFVYVYFQND